MIALRTNTVLPTPSFYFYAPPNLSFPYTPLLTQSVDTSKIYLEIQIRPPRNIQALI